MQIQVLISCFPPNSSKQNVQTRYVHYMKYIIKFIKNDQERRGRSTNVEIIIKYESRLKSYISSDLTKLDDGRSGPSSNWTPADALIRTVVVELAIVNDGNGCVIYIESLCSDQQNSAKFLHLFFLHQNLPTPFFVYFRNRFMMITCILNFVILFQRP